MKESKFKFIDLFAGIGGIRIPFCKLGGKCVFTSEVDTKAAEVYKNNYQEMPHGDICQVPNEDIPCHDLLLAGFPCQPFSNAGLKAGFADETRGTLFFEIERILEYHKPVSALLENVKGLVNHDKGQTFSIIERKLDDLGYWVKAIVLNAKDFGVPQNRERLYIVCLRKDLVRSIDFKFPVPPNRATKLGDILENDVDPKYTLSDTLWAGHVRRKEEHKINGNGFGYSLFSSDSPYTSTISARYYKDGSEILIEQKTADGQQLNPRKITPREAARLQGFPDKFKIHTSDSQAYKQFGNSVAVPVIAAIAKNLVPVIRKAIEKKMILDIVSKL
jgi:DNA (cytosine-5)-methyltransferase 1